MMRYFREEPPELGISYYEYDGDYNIRRIEITNGQWSYATENYRRDYLADQPLSESENHPVTWEYEISAEEFEKVWDEALKRSPTKQSSKMNDERYSNCSKAFYVDGSYRDIYVLETDEQDWQKLLDFLRLGPYSTEFSVGGESASLPERVATIFAMDYTTLLQIDEGHLALHCHFFIGNGIEFDLDPRDFQGENACQQIARLLDFIRTIGLLLNKTVLLTPENSPEFVFFSFDPKIRVEKWYWKNIFYESYWSTILTPENWKP